ncbi:FCGR2 protein, partial [Notiomystis cincta]|nr:FCGR2 protein [Notiomystis cincta]
ALLEGDTVTLRCRAREDKSLSWVSFYHEEKKLEVLHNGTELSLSPLQPHHGGRYRCRGCVDTGLFWGQEELVTVPVPLTV